MPHVRSWAPSSERPRSVSATCSLADKHATMADQYQEDFNSSDLDFGPEHDDRDTNIGKRARASIVNQSVSDRVASKKAVKLLKHAANSPGTDYPRRYWLSVFDEFATATLGIEKRPK